MKELTSEEISEQIKNNTFVVHQSRLKSLLGEHPNRFLKPFGKTSEAMILGHLTETILLEPDKVEDRFEILKSSPPSGIVADLIRYALDEWEDKKETMEDQRDKWIALGKANNIGNNWKDDTMFNKFENHQLYWSYLLNRDITKEPITSDMYDLAKNMAQSVATDKEAGKWFQNTSKQKILIQYVIDFEYLDVPCSGIIDILVVDLENKTLRIVDFKTTGLGLYSAARKFRWDIQGAFYHYGISKNPPEEYKDFKTLAPVYVVVNINNVEEPETKYFSDKDLLTGMHGMTPYKQIDYSGGPINFPGKPLEGFHQLIKRYQFHQASEQWRYKREHYDEDFKNLLNIW